MPPTAYGLERGQPHDGAAAQVRDARLPVHRVRKQHAAVLEQTVLAEVDRGGLRNGLDGVQQAAVVQKVGQVRRQPRVQLAAQRDGLQRPRRAAPQDARRMLREPWP